MARIDFDKASTGRFGVVVTESITGIRYSDAEVKYFIAQVDSISDADLPTALSSYCGRYHNDDEFSSLSFSSMLVQIGVQSPKCLARILSFSNVPYAITEKSPETVIDLLPLLPQREQYEFIAQHLYGGRQYGEMADYKMRLPSAKQAGYCRYPPAKDHCQRSAKQGIRLRRGRLAERGWTQT